MNDRLKRNFTDDPEGAKLRSKIKRCSGEQDGYLFFVKKNEERFITAVYKDREAIRNSTGWFVTFTDGISDFTVRTRSKLKFEEGQKVRLVLQAETVE